MVAPERKFEPVKTKKKDATEAKNVELVKRFYQHLDSGKLDDLAALFDPKVKIFYESGTPLSLDELVPLVKMFYTAFPDFKHIIEDVFAVGDKVVARQSYTGSFKNGFMGFEPNGSSFRYVGVHIFQFTDGRVSTLWAVEDELGMMTQLGLELKPR